MTWQIAVVIVIELVALTFLVSRFWPRERRPKASNVPDVKTASLLRKKKEKNCH